jgi:transposase
MLGEREPQRPLFSTATQLGPKTVEGLGFYGKLASEGHRLFRDADFAGAYCPDNGRPSVPPSVLALARLLQHFDGVSDAEVVERCQYDLRWKVALDLELASVEAPFAKSTFQAFRARLTVHLQEGLAFERSVQAARAAGLLPSRLRVALDSSPVRGRGAVKDTFNLLSDAIVAIVRAVAAQRKTPAATVAREAGIERHVEAASLKGSELVDWDQAGAVSAFLADLLQDCDRAVALAEQAGCATEEVALLRKVIAQDVACETPDGPPILRQGVAPDRTVSVHDPEMRHGRKSNGKGYNGHKAHLAVEVTSGVITAVDVTAPADADGAQVKALLEQTQQSTGQPIEQALGDTAYSTRTGLTQAHDAKVELVTKMPSPPEGRHGPGAFQVSEDGNTAQCPAGVASAQVQRRADGALHVWSPQNCGPCALKPACTTAAARTLLVPPDFHERRRRERYARSEEGRALLRQRMAVEHAIGRIKNLGGGRARYFGRAKTRAQWLWAAAVANLSLVWGREAAMAS